MHKCIFALKPMKSYLNHFVETYAISFFFLFRPDFEGGLRDFKIHVANYQKASLLYMLLMVVLSELLL